MLRVLLYVTRIKKSFPEKNPDYTCLYNNKHFIENSRIKSFKKVFWMIVLKYNFTRVIHITDCLLTCLSVEIFNYQHTIFIQFCSS